ncbi:hypothetical protein RRG08_063238 [Elysia crispata]|uniref:Uncharacterized protein n=1 Tax=Elysia crispata TaxID=231223 RepID=A0AAE0Y9H0_9GAST|nr:hypothetical protein RRG08_063238 [Elysia crispata]
MAQLMEGRRGEIGWVNQVLRQPAHVPRQMKNSGYSNCISVSMETIARTWPSLQLLAETNLSEPRLGQR